ncbi:AfsR/SARP family transcriptional regulator [Streptomyces scabichelini]|uniref:AfsR/SARP family transcriptional regulator n=1 Tax=Streptomyces scabichelini TaxID=2711217 RepID=UPI0030B9F34D
MDVGGTRLRALLGLLLVRAGLGRFVHDNPLRERGRELLLRALYAAGRHTEALEQYRAYRELLADELGLEPSAALQRLEEQILRHEVSPAIRPRGHAAHEDSPAVVAPLPPPRGRRPGPGAPGSPLRRPAVSYLRVDGDRRLAYAYARVGDGLPPRRGAGLGHQPGRAGLRP